jgi:HD superfamily phosphohydrolase
MASTERNKPAYRAFEDDVEFFDDVIGPIHLNHVERDCVDSPEFQRLFRIGQLGFIDLVYHTANHTRGIHSIGACARSKQLIEHLRTNTPRVEKARRRTDHPERAMPTIARSEGILISLAALLHDIPHGPLSHDIEKKTHRYDNRKKKLRSFYGPYDKHDDFERNPALYLILTDVSRSILARVLEHHSPDFLSLLQEDAEERENAHLVPFVAALKNAQWSNLKTELLSRLVFHTLAFEEYETALQHSSMTMAKDFDSTIFVDWGLGPQAHWDALHKSWYQPYRHDIVGDTLSADLLDYLARDAQRLGIRNVLDSKLLNSYVLVDFPAEDRPASAAFESVSLARCAIDLNDYKRGVIRSERINDIFRMLDFRHEIHEKAVYHRVVQSAIAMASRALLTIPRDKRPTIGELYNLGTTGHAVSGDDYLLKRIAELSNPRALRRETHTIGQRLIERRVYRPLMIIQGDQAHEMLHSALHGIADNDQEEALRLLGAILDSTYFAPFFCLISWCVERLLDHSLETVEDVEQFIRKTLESPDDLAWAQQIIPRRLIIWTTPYKQLYKDPGIVVRAFDQVGRIDDLVAKGASPEPGGLPKSLLSRLKAGLDDASSRYAAMWKVYVFLSDGLYYSGGLARLIRDHPCASDRGAHKAHLEEAQHSLILAIRVACEWWTRRGWNEGEKDDASRNLGDSINDSDLTKLLQLYLGGRHNYTRYFARDRKRLAAVNIEQYLHIEPDTSCRDVRYRFDRPADLAACLGELKLNHLEKGIRSFFEFARGGVAGLGHEEVGDIIAHLGVDLADEQLVENLQKAARDGAAPNATLLRERWLAAELGRKGRDEQEQEPNGLTNGDKPSSRTIPPTSPGNEAGRPRRPRRNDGGKDTGRFSLLESADTPVDDSGGIQDPAEATPGSDDKKGRA